MRTLTLLALTAGLLCAQTLPNLEVRGRVVEPGFDFGVAGAEVTFSVVENATRNPIATTFTDSTGGFRFQAPRPGNYFVESKKDGYQGGAPAGDSRGLGNDVSLALFTEAPVRLTGDRPSPELRFYLVRPGEVTGRVVDENRQPIAGLRVAVQKATRGAAPAELTAATGEDGTFRVSKVPPGELLVVLPQSGDMERLRTEFSPEDAAVVSQEIEVSRNPVRVSSGATVNLGTIVARAVPYYRVRVSVAGECGSGEKWNFAALRTIGGSIDMSNFHYAGITCARELLVENLRPGSYLFVMWEGQAGSPNKWAQAPVEIAGRNLDLALTLTPGADISGRVVAADGARLPLPATFMIMPQPPDTAFLFLSGTPMGTADAEGKFVLKQVPWLRHQIRVMLPPTHYVKEVRYGGRAAEQGVISLTPGAQLEIVIDDKAASVAGSVISGDKPVTEGAVRAVRWPLPPPELLGGLQYSNTIRDGRFQFTGLTPGDYRIFAVSAADAASIQDWAVLNQFASRAETIHLGPSESRTLTLQVLR